MPLQTSYYEKRPWYLFNRHMETVIPSLFYKVDGINYQRERLELEDGDFLDLDWLAGGNNRLLILSHGLEGSAGRHYIQRPAKFFSNKGWDILAWNNRSCSGEMNRLPRFYHHGGVSIRSLARAASQLLLSGQIQSGGSTITMQVARNFEMVAVICEFIFRNQ